MKYVDMMLSWMRRKGVGGRASGICVKVIGLKDYVKYVKQLPITCT